MATSAPDAHHHRDALEEVLAAAPPAGGLDAPAARRNAAPILDVLLREAAPRGTVLEVGSGTGQHAAAFAAPLHPRAWQPTELDGARLRSIGAWRGALPAGRPVPLPPLALDATAPADRWPLADLGPIAAILCVNVIHIAPWSVARGLFAGAARWLAEGAPLILYGPFARDGAHTGPGNASFDAALRAEDPAWGVRDLEREILPEAARVGLSLSAVHPMPANNLSVVFRR